MPPNVWHIRWGIIERSTEAFLILNQKITNEVDMRDLTIKFLTEMHSDVNPVRTLKLYHQVSSDGHHLGIVYCVYDEPVSRKGKLFVAIADLRLLKNNTKHVTICEDMADEDYDEDYYKDFVYYMFKFSADLSILHAQGGIYDLLSDDMMTVRFSGHIADDWVANDPEDIIFSPCNRFVCFIIHHDFHIFEICRLKKILMKLNVCGAKFSSKVDCHGKFHPNLPIILLCSQSTNEEYDFIKVDLLSLEAIKTRLSYRKRHPPPLLRYVALMHQKRNPLSEHQLITQISTTVLLVGRKLISLPAGGSHGLGLRLILFSTRKIVWSGMKYRRATH